MRPGAQVWLIYALFFVSGVTQAAIVPLLPRLSARYGLSPSQAALLLALPGLATLAVSVPSGVAADRFGARRPTLAAAVLMCMSCVAQAAPSLALLVAGRLAFGVAYGVVWTTGIARLAELEGGEDGSGGRIGPSITCSSVGTMVGPAVGGLLAGHGATGAPFLLIAIVAALVVAPLALDSGVAAAVATGGAADRPGAANRSGSPDGPDAADGRAAPDPADRPDPVPTPAAPGLLRVLAALARRPGLGAAAGSLIVSGALSGVTQLLISAGLHADGLSAGGIGLAFSAAAISYIVVSGTVVRLGRRARTRRFNALAATLGALALAPAALSDRAAVLVLALVLTALARAAISTIAYSLPALPPYASGPESTAEGSMFGVLNGAWAGALVLMPLLAGAVEQRGGAQVAYLAVILPAGVIAAVLLTRSGARGRATRDEPVTTESRTLHRLDRANRAAAVAPPGARARGRITLRRPRDLPLAMRRRS